MGIKENFTCKTLFSSSFVNYQVSGPINSPQKCDKVFLKIWVYDKELYNLCLTSALYSHKSYSVQELPVLITSKDN